jgi:hypothetical protein
MKKLLLVAACIVASVGALAQGNVLFDNLKAGATQFITDADGSKLSGTGFLAQLYAGADANSLAPVGAALSFRTGAAAGFVSTAGVDATRTIPGVATGGTANFLQIRAWDATGGATYDAAVGSGKHFGSSAIFSAANLGGPDAGGGPAHTPANLTNFKGFSLIPEPSTIALGVLGAAALLLRRRN